MKRYALVTGLGATEATVAAYLPSGYKVIWGGPEGVVIEGQDRPGGGFTLHGYVIPRLGSGCMMGVEIDLSHPVMKKIPA